ncbi:MAG: biopolymer transporter ExbD [Deltaproteobacteria bacterium]|nr:biopolymer transporter ExbD [Deltaproteobacteria bacterium]
MAGGTLGSGDEDEIISGINVTPLVDITLVLLIIFMVTATYIVRETIEIDLPEAANAGETVETTLALVIDSEGAIYLNGEPSSEADLRNAVPELLAQAKAAGEKLQAILSADKAVSHGRVVRIIDLVKGLGVSRFAINIEKNETADAPANDAPAPEPATP